MKISKKISIFCCIFLLTLLFPLSLLFCPKKASAESRVVVPLIQPVAKVLIFASDNNSSTSDEISNSGHAFIMVENIGKSTITVGKMSLSRNACLTIGTWGNQSEHIGLWYNLENYIINRSDVYDGRVSLETLIFEEDLSPMNTYINSHDSWSVFSNCSTFATNLWNSIADINLDCGTINTPLNLKKSIMKHNYTVNATVKYNYKIGYYHGNTFIQTINTTSRLDINENNLIYV